MHPSLTDVTRPDITVGRARPFGGMDALGPDAVGLWDGVAVGLCVAPVPALSPEPQADRRATAHSALTAYPIGRRPTEVRIPMNLGRREPAKGSVTSWLGKCLGLKTGWTCGSTVGPTSRVALIGTGLRHESAGTLASEFSKDFANF